MTDRNPPYSKDDIQRFTEYQNSKRFHPYTCGNGCGNLMMNEEGLYCPSCDYKQQWIHPESLTIIEQTTKKEGIIC